LKIIKKLFLAAVIFVIFVSVPVYANQTVSVVIDGQRVNFPIQSPVIIDGRTLVPVRYVMEVLLNDPDNVEYDRANNQVNIFETVAREDE